MNVPADSNYISEVLQMPFMKEELITMFYKERGDKSVMNDVYELQLKQFILSDVYFSRYMKKGSDTLGHMLNLYPSKPKMSQEEVEKFLPKAYAATWGTNN